MKRFYNWEKADIPLYHDTIERLLEDIPAIEDPDEAAKLLINALKTATDIAVPVKTILPGKNKPYNDDIKELIKQSKEADWKWKQNGRPPDPHPLFTERSRVRKCLRNAQTIEVARQRENEVNEIMTAKSSDQKLFYKLIRKQRKTTSNTPPSLEVNGKVYRENLLNAWTDHFSTLAAPSDNEYFNEEFKQQVEEDVAVIENICKNIHSTNIPISRFEVKHAVDKLKNRNAKDEDGLIAENLKYAVPNLLSLLTSMINKIVETRRIPITLKCAILHPIHKKGKSINISGHYRGISITSIISKVVDTIQVNHQEASITHKQHNQFSFTKKRTPAQASIILTELMGEAKDSKKTLIATTLDIEKAFDNMSHTHQLRKLYLAGLTGRWWTIKQDSYQNMSTKVRKENLEQPSPICKVTDKAARAAPMTLKNTHLITLRR